MVLAQETDFNGKEYTDFGRVAGSSSGLGSSSSQTNQNINVYNENSIVPVDVFGYVSSSFSLTSSLTLLAQLSFPFDFYLTNISIETLNGQASFYIQIGNISINSPNNLGSCFSSVNFSYLFPFIPYVQKNNSIAIYGLSSATGVYIHFALNGFRA